MPTLPSVLLLVADDLPRQLLGAYGAPHGLSPHLDELARTGVRFDRGYTTSPLCTPSRYSIQTGRHASGADTASGPWASRAHPGLRRVDFTGCLSSGSANDTLAGRLRGRGFVTGFVGKWHISCARGGSGSIDAASTVRRDGGFDFASDVYLANSQMTAHAHNPEWMAHEAIRFVALAQSQARPFFLQWAPTLTHTPADVASQLLAAPRSTSPPGGGGGHDRNKTGHEHASAFVSYAVSLREAVRSKLIKAKLLCKAGPSAAPSAPALRVCPTAKLPNISHLVGPATWQPLPNPTRGGEVLAGPNLGPMPHSLLICLAYTAWLDATVPAVLRRAEAAAGEGGLLVVFTADHGNGYTDKGHAYEGGIRVPFIVSMRQGTTAPGWRRGAAVPSPVSHLDLMPTILALTASGEARDAGPYSRSLLPLLKESTSEAERSSLLETLDGRPIFIEVGYSRTVLLGRWKLMAFGSERDDAVVDASRKGKNCTGIHGDLLTPYIAQLTASASAPPAATDRSAKPKEGGREGGRPQEKEEGRSKDEHLLYSAFVRHPTTYCDAVQLYNTVTDPREERNVAGLTPDITRSLGSKLAEFVRAQEPKANWHADGLPPQATWYSQHPTPIELRAWWPWGAYA